MFICHIRAYMQTVVLPWILPQVLEGHWDDRSIVGDGGWRPAAGGWRRFL